MRDRPDWGSGACKTNIPILEILKNAAKPSQGHFKVMVNFLVLRRFFEIVESLDGQ